MQMSFWGELNCLKYFLLDNNFYNISWSMICIYNRPNQKLRGESRIGPHNLDILSIIIGSLLGDAHAEKRSMGKGTRITFYQEASHVEYLLYLHNQISVLGYCNSNIPEIQTRLGKGGKVRKIIRFSTSTYTSWNWIHDSFYPQDYKIVPRFIGQYLTPLALAIWIMDDGARVSRGIKLCTNCFSYSDSIYLIGVLLENFQIKASIISAGNNQFNIYIWKQSKELLWNIVQPYIIPEMKYKFIS